jgi:hypothetical protein
MRKMLASFVLLVAVAPATSLGEWPYINAKLRGKKVAIGKVIILPPRITIVRSGVKGGEGMETEAESLAERLYQAIRSELSARGVSVVENALGDGSDTAKYAIANLQSKFDNLRTPIGKRPSRVEEGRFTMGDSVASFAPGKADAFLFIRGGGVVQTKGKKVLAAVLLNPFLAMSSFQADVTIVDARSGEVLAFLRMRQSSDATRNSGDRLLNAAHRLLQEVPLPVAPAK